MRRERLPGLFLFSSEELVVLSARNGDSSTVVSVGDSKSCQNVDRRSNLAISPPCLSSARKAVDSPAFLFLGPVVAGPAFGSVVAGPVVGAPVVGAPVAGVEANPAEKREATTSIPEQQQNLTRSQATDVT